MFTLFIILMIMGLGVMICEKIEEIKDEIEYKITTRKLAKYYNSEEYKMKGKEELKEEKQETVETKHKNYDSMTHLYCMEQEFGIKFTNVPGTANKKTQDSIKNMSKIINEAANAEKKMNELKEEQKKVLQRKKELEQLINDRKGKQITMDEWERKIDKQNIIKEIKEQKEKEALSNEGIQMSLFEEEIIVTEKEIEDYKNKQVEELRKYTKAFSKEHLLQIEINITEKSNEIYKGTFKRTSKEYCFIWDGEHYPMFAPKDSSIYRKINKSWGKHFEKIAEEIMLQCDPSCNLFEIKRKEENKRQEKINKISLEIEDLDI